MLPCHELLDTNTHLDFSSPLCPTPLKFHPDPLPPPPSPPSTPLPSPSISLFPSPPPPPPPSLLPHALLLINPPQPKSASPSKRNVSNAKHSLPKWLPTTQRMQAIQRTHFATTSNILKEESGQGSNPRIMPDRVRNGCAFGS